MVKTNLKNYSEKLSVPIMIPLSSKAMIPGKLVHTNQVLVGLGDNWFSKVSTKSAVENCDRKIKFCSEMIKKYDQEKNILDSRLKFPASDEGKEIIEPYNEEEMKKWRENHREMEKKYHQEKNKEEKEVKASVAEEELWRKLDELELQEELEDQLFLNGDEQEDEESEEENDEEAEIDSGHSSEEDEMIDLRVRSNRTIINECEPLIQHVPLSKSSTTNEDNVINIMHTDIEPKPVSYCTDSPYQTPTCIYKEYLTSVKKFDHIKKKVVFNLEKNTEKLPEKENVDNVIQHDLVLSNITENQVVADSKKDTIRPVSKFKSSRKS